MTENQFKDRMTEVLARFIVKAEAVQTECRKDLMAQLEETRETSISNEVMEMFYDTLLHVSEPPKQGQIS